MAENTEQRGVKIDGQMQIKVEPTLQCYVEEEHENGFAGFENANTVPSSADVGALNLWTSKATTCLISQYKKYRSMVGQSTQIRSLREMFEMISLEMQNYGFYFSPQKCENKWRVLERKYKNLLFRERLKKPGRMRHYGHWEHKTALDEIFNEKQRLMYIEEGDFNSSSATTGSKYTLILPKPTEQGCTTTNNNNNNNNNNVKQQHHHHQHQEDPLATTSLTTSIVSTSDAKHKEASFLENGGPLIALFEKFLEEMGKNFTLAERNKERRHKEEMAMRQSELDVKKKLLKLEEQKMELRKSQMIAAAQHLHLNMQ